MFVDRWEAGELLAQRIHEGDIVCAIPRGGVIVARPIAEHLKVPLTIVAVKKITNPQYPEYALGAAGASMYDASDTTPIAWIDHAQKRAAELENRFAHIDLEGKHAILVDDGAATGSTFLLAIRITRKRGALTVTAALPVASITAAEAIEARVDSAIILRKPFFFDSVGSFYDSFEQVPDVLVDRLLVS